MAAEKFDERSGVLIGEAGVSINCAALEVGKAVDILIICSETVLPMTLSELNPASQNDNKIAKNTKSLLTTDYVIVNTCKNRLKGSLVWKQYHFRSAGLIVSQMMDYLP